MDNVFSIEHVFSNRLFRIPDYQRGYAWDKRQLRDLLEDIELLGPGKTHFTGTLVLHDTGHAARDSGMTSYTVYNVVDGQQRLTALVILLDMIRRAMLDAGMPQERTEGIRKSYVGAEGLDGQPLYKLTLNQDCDSYFRENILADPPSPSGPSMYSHKRLADAKHHFLDYLARKREERGVAFPEWLMDLCDKVTSRLVVCLYEIDDVAEVGVIFETMNDRGKPVSELEKVKNYLLYVGSKLNVDNSTLTDRVNDAWSSVFGNLMEADLVDMSREEQLLRMHWLMAYDPDPKKWEGCRSVKKRMGLRRFEGKHEGLVAQTIEYAETLKSSSVAYRDAANPDHNSAFAGFPQSPVRESIRKWSRKLERLNVLGPFLPLLAATRLRFPEKPERYLKVVQLCEVFGFRVYTLLGRRADAGQTRLYRLGHDLFKGEIISDNAMREFRDTLFEYCTDRQFNEAFEFDPEFNWYEWNGLKYFLYEYEDHLAQQSKHQVEVAWQVVQQKKRSDTIEHILPQEASGKYWRSRFKADDRKRFTHDLGNLTLSTRGDNSSLSNDPFPDKVGQPGQDHRYITSNFRIARELCEYDDWTPEQLQVRRQKLVAWGKERWGSGHIRDLIGELNKKPQKE